MRYLVYVSYDGSNYYGWQKQKGLKTISEEIENALKKIFLCEIIIFGSGRTDRFVHAKKQVFHFDVDKEIPLNNLKKALNTFLPNDIYINEVFNSNIHARFDVLKKEYHYHISNKYDPLKRNYVLFERKKIDVNKMKSGINIFLGEHDFTSFTPFNERRKNKLRTIYNIEIIEKNDEIIVCLIGSGFLQYMVRNIVSALIEIGQNKISVEEMNYILKQKKRTSIPKTIEAHGLVLVDVMYEEG